MKRIAQIALTVSVVAMGASLGYAFATNHELRSRFTRSARDAYHVTRKKVNVVSEEVALRAAKMTKNPKINQEWVNNQWESLNL